jgi:anti-anti-sigma factor
MVNISFRRASLSDLTASNKKEFAMGNAENHPFHINVSISDETANIYLVGYFSFRTHIEFKSVYKNQLVNSKITGVAVHLADVSYIDSSALGMLLMLRDQAQATNKKLPLVHPSDAVKHSFGIANFSKLFTISE